MVKKRLLWIFVLTVFAIFTITGLYNYSKYRKQRANNFVRELPPFMISANQVKKLPYRSLYIAGITDSSIFLASRNYKNFVIKSNLKNLDTSSFIVSSDKALKISEDSHLQIDTKNIFLMQGSLANIKKGPLGEMSVNKDIKIPAFTDAIPISSNSFVFRFIDQKKENKLGKIVAGNLELGKSQILEKQVDGIFCTDGSLVKAFGSDRFFYVYFYRNQFLSIDTNVELKYRANTIDTNSLAKIKVSKINSNGDVTLSAPPIYVNKKAAANSTHIFIQSSLKADNEMEELFETVTPIDVYQAEGGKYVYSFYIPDFGKEKVKDFKVNEKMLVVLYETAIYTFKLNGKDGPYKNLKSKL